MDSLDSTVYVPAGKTKFVFEVGFLPDPGDQAEITSMATGAVKTITRTKQGKLHITGPPEEK